MTAVLLDRRISVGIVDDNEKACSTAPLKVVVNHWTDSTPDNSDPPASQ